MIKQIVHIESCGSTNAEVFRYHAKMQNKTPFVLYCDTQSKGRGMGKNKWESQSKKNLTCSIVEYPAFLSPYSHFYFSMTVALAVDDILKYMGVRSNIKWPNDVLIESKKICGILIETEMQSNSIKMMVAGIGLNVNQTDFSEHSPHAVSLKQIGIHKLKPETVLNMLIPAFNDRYRQLEAEQYSTIKENYLSRLMGYREWKSYTDGQNRFKAQIVDVRDNGILRVQKESGKTCTYEMKEIKMIGL
jgi:BirA family biotin operon repressor/biotin-[acetyl-CoA-carboxylase] ligase